MALELPENLDLEFQERADPKVLSSLGKIGQALVVIFNHLKSIKIDWPKIFKVEGTVDVNSISDFPPIHIQNFKDLKPYFEMADKTNKQLAAAITLVASKGPDKPATPIVNINNEPLLKAIQELKEVSDKTIELPSNEGVISMLRTVSEQLGALYDKPTFVPPAVTNITLNALNGSFKSTTLNVTTTATALPSTNLTNRRSLIIYNNSSNTVYLGNSSVTISGSTQGLPVPANSYGPTLDAGSNMVLYGIAGGTSSVTVMEMSHEASGR